MEDFEANGACSTIFRTLIASIFDHKDLLAGRRYVSVERELVFAFVSDRK